MTPEQQQREDLARVTLESMGWQINYVHPAQEPDELAGVAGTLRQACVARSFARPGGQPQRKVLTGPSLVWCLAEACAHEERLAALKPGVRPVAVDGAAAAVEVRCAYDGDTAQTARNPKQSRVVSTIGEPGRVPGGR